VISGIDGAAKEFATLRIRPCNDEVLTTHHVPLKACCHKPVNVFSYWYENFTSEMTALFTAVELILEVYGCCTVLCKEFGKLEYC